MANEAATETDRTREQLLADALFLRSIVEGEIARRGSAGSSMVRSGLLLELLNLLLSEQSA